MSAAAQIRVKRGDVTPRLMRLKDGAAYIAVSPWQLRNLVQRGDLPVVRIADSGPWLLDVRDLDAWIDRSKVVMD
jgi:hypothetical protein